MAVTRKDHKDLLVIWQQAHMVSARQAHPRTKHGLHKTVGVTPVSEMPTYEAESGTGIEVLLPRICSEWRQSAKLRHEPRSRHSNTGWTDVSGGRLAKRNQVSFVR